MKIPLLDVNRQNKPLEAELKLAACRVVEDGRFINGPEVGAFEKELADYCNTVSSSGGDADAAGKPDGGAPRPDGRSPDEPPAHVIACASGSDALIVAFMALDLQPGDEVITTPYTFFATTACLTRLGLVPVYVDINRDTFNLDVSQIEAKITPRTRAILPVHLFGHSVDMDAVLDIARRHNLRVVEDAAQSLGARWHGRMVGTLGDIGIYSFYPSKNLGGFGDGGALITRNAALAEKLRVLCAHGSRPKYHHHMVGVNSRLDTLQAAMLRIKLRHLETYHAERSIRAAQYTAALQPLATNSTVSPNSPGATSGGLLLSRPDPRGTHVHNQYCIRHPRRDALREALTARTIGSEIYYPIPLHLQPCFAFLGHRPGDFPVSEEAARTSLALPIFGELTEAEVAYVCAAIAEFVQPE